MAFLYIGRFSYCAIKIGCWKIIKFPIHGHHFFSAQIFENLRNVPSSLLLKKSFPVFNIIFWRLTAFPHPPHPLDLKRATFKTSFKVAPRSCRFPCNLAGIKFPIPVSTLASPYPIDSFTDPSPTGIGTAFCWEFTLTPPQQILFSLFCFYFSLSGYCRPFRFFRLFFRILHLFF